MKIVGLLFVATTRANVSPSLIMELLQRIARVTKDYLGILSEESLRRNFVLVYELLDEVIVSTVDFIFSLYCLLVFYHGLTSWYLISGQTLATVLHLLKEDAISIFLLVHEVFIFYVLVVKNLWNISHKNLVLDFLLLLAVFFCSTKFMSNCVGFWLCANNIHRSIEILYF